MDGGWFFPVDVPIKFALEASDAGDPVNRLAQWAEENGIQRCLSVGRDMGAAPPRQTEIRFLVTGESFDEQLNRALSAFEAFGFPMLPGTNLSNLYILFASHIPIADEMLSLIRASPRPGLAISVITSSEGFVRLGLLTPEPDRNIVEQLCQVGGGAPAQLIQFEQSLGVNGPAYAEYQVNL